MLVGRHAGVRVVRPEALVAVDGAGLEPAELEALLVAFHRYEAALMADDVAVLDDSFAPGPETLRGDALGLLVGHDRISAFRSARGGVAKRTITEVRVRVLSPTAALVVSVSAFAAGGTGLQTQLWERVASTTSDDVAAGRWVITVAHVTGAAPALNRAVWRVVGAPLVPPLPDTGVGSAAEPMELAGGASAGPARVLPSGSAGQVGVGGASAASRPVGGGGVVGARGLEGMTVAVKDLFGVAGFAIGAGVPAYLAGTAVAEVDSDAVHALRAAGAAVQGIAQTDEFAYSIAGRNVHYGTALNGAVPGAMPGGSSSGPASAVALGQATIGLGTDTGGSIRVPASYQGLWGIRTTHGAVSTRGLLPLAPSFDTVGWLTRSPEALRAAAEASLPEAAGVTGAAGATEASGGAGAPMAGALARRFAVSREIVVSCEPAVQKAFVSLLADPVVTAAGVEEVDLGDLDEVFAAFRTVQGAEAWRQHGSWIEAHPGELGPDIAERFEVAATVTAEAEEAAMAVLAEARARFDRVLEGRILLLPSASSPAPAVTASADDIQAVRAATLRMTSVAGAGGYPAVSAPLLHVPEPVGLCFVGPRGSDLALIDLAAEIAAALAA
ncbi:AtzH-like domain-containing protein [Herbiconiux sp. P15]|uniref:AtzH-like domain-containing protein n=1 Tax=Herbiconiux liukaitaii TaxID=3342799 RepID=UPI0035BB1AE6